MYNDIWSIFFFVYITSVFQSSSTLFKVTPFCLQTFTFLNSKCEHAHLMKRNPRKVTWTVLYRRKHKKGQEEEATKKRTRRTQKFQRAIVGASLNDIMAKRNQRPEVRKAQREQAIRYLFFWCIWNVRTIFNIISNLRCMWLNFFTTFITSFNTLLYNQDDLWILQYWDCQIWKKKRYWEQFCYWLLM